MELNKKYEEINLENLNMKRQMEAIKQNDSDEKVKNL